MRSLLSLLIFSVLAFGQAPEYTQSQLPPNTPVTLLQYRDGSNNVEYVCKALSNQPTYTWSVAAATLVSIVVSSNTATITFSANHGLAVGNRLSIRGGTVDADINADYLVATGGTTTLTVTTSAVADGTYTDATLVLYTTAPRNNAAMWSIYRNFYTTTYLDRTSWAEGSSAMTKTCSSRTTYAYN